MPLPLEEKATYFERASGAIVISEADFEEALLATRAAIEPNNHSDIKPAYAADYGTRIRAAELAGAANDPASLGVVADYDPSAEKRPFSGNLFFVVSDPAFDDGENRLQATQYRVVAIELSGNASFVGTDVQFAQIDSQRTGMGRRCCGPSTLCSENPSIPFPPGPGGGPLFPPTSGGPYPARVGVTDSHYGLWDNRVQTGNPVIKVEFYQPGVRDPITEMPVFVDPDNPPQGHECIRTQDPDCTNTTYICDVDQPGYFPNDDGKPDISVGSNPCGGMTRPVDIPRVPEWCTIAYLLDECRGRVPWEYNQAYPVRESTDPFCTVVRPVSPESRCGESYEQSLLTRQLNLQRQAGWSPGRMTKQCTPLLNGGANDMQTCVECDRDGNCREKVERLPSNPIADTANESITNQPEPQNNSNRVVAMFRINMLA